MGNSGHVGMTLKTNQQPLRLYTTHIHEDFLQWPAFIQQTQLKEAGSRTGLELRRYLLNISWDFLLQP